MLHTLFMSPSFEYICASEIICILIFVNPLKEIDY